MPIAGQFAWFSVLVLSVSALAAVIIWLLPEEAERPRTIVNIAAASVKLALILTLLPFFFSGIYPTVSWTVLPGLQLVLRVDSLAMLFALLSSILWLLTTIYAIGYLREDRHRRRFFGFFSLCVTATVGIAFAGNLTTFVIFFELLSLVTYPLVAHYGTPAALKAARTYLLYTLFGGLSLLTGTVAINVLAGSTQFTEGGNPAVRAFAENQPAIAVGIFWLMIVGLGVKGALVGLHHWLPTAMVAPAPVSALLHAVAVVKAGAFGIVRVVDDLFGVSVARELGVLDFLLIWAAATIIYASLRALSQTDLKRRLAYSTVSQVSFITLGMAMYSLTATTGGVVHLFHQGITKITLFFCAGLFAERLGVKTVSAMSGLGRRMPWTSLAFTIGAFGMIGLPPLAGFISKWTLGLGAMDADRPWVVAVLATSAALNCAYFLPIVYRMWYPAPGTAGVTTTARALPVGQLLVPTLITAGLAIAAGLLAPLPFSPLDLATYIADRSFP